MALYVSKKSGSINDPEMFDRIPDGYWVAKSPDGMYFGVSDGSWTALDMGIPLGGTARHKTEDGIKRAVVIEVFGWFSIQDQEYQESRVKELESKGWKFERVGQ